MERHSLRDSLRQLIGDETQLAHGLSQSLAEESEALREVNPEALDTVTTIKQQCVEQLAACDAQRQHLCRVLGVPANLDGMQQLLDHAGDDRLREQWQGLVALLETCQEANLRNGAIVTLQRRRVTDALGLLRGDSQQCAMYDAQGEIGESDFQRLNAET